MPPAAISRSSTYFPKICGNIAPAQRSAFRAPLLAVVALAGCGTPEARVTTLTIRTHELGFGCALAEDPETLTDYTLALTALGPFPADGSEVAAQVRLDESGRELTFDARTAGIDAEVTRAGGPVRDPEPAFAGHSERRKSAGIDVLLWPRQRACTLSPGPYPSDNPGQALGYSTRAGLALSAGEAVSQSAKAEGAGPGSALIFDADLGSAGVVPREGALHIPRAFATVTAFGDDLLVAGGDNPLGASSLDPSGSAELFSAAAREFAEPFDLILHRTHHAAVTLSGSGETLLVGGIEPTLDDADWPPGYVTLLEAVSPPTQAGSKPDSSISELAEADVQRVDPIALVLDDGRVFVGGGYLLGRDAAHPTGTPLGAVDYLSPDAKNAILYAELPARPHRAFVAMPGGGVLSVASCSEAPGPDCACVSPDGVSCDPLAAEQPFIDGYWLDPEGNVERVAFATQGATAACPTPRQPMLAPGSDGSAWLVSAGLFSADGDSLPACLWRFEPWPGDPSGDGDARPGPRFVPSDIRLDPAPDPRAPLASLGPDAFVWVAAGPSAGLAGVQLGHRGPLTRDGELLTAAPGGALRPVHLAPDGDPSPPPGAVRRARATFDSTFRLKLEPPESPSPPLTIWVADTRYDDSTTSLALVAPRASADAASVLPVLVFGTTPVGGVSCTWPIPSPSSTSSGQLAASATRRGTTVTLAVAGTPSTTRCEVAPGPLALGVRAGETDTTLVSFRVERE